MHPNYSSYRKKLLMTIAVISLVWRKNKSQTKRMKNKTVTKVVIEWEHNELNRNTIKMEFK